MDNHIAITALNDFIFCPYSIYLHAVYMGSDEDIYKALPQIKGTIAHSGIDNRNGSRRKADIAALPVYSDELGLCGVIDLLRQDRGLLIERKYIIKNIFRGQLYQLWAQYFCLTEMGYNVESLAFYEISTNKMIYRALPTDADKQELITVIDQFRKYRPDKDHIDINPNKCRHCIYCNLCDKTHEDNVYT